MSVELEIRLFATLKDRAGSDRIRVELPDRAATAADVIRAVAAGYPALAPALPSALLAVNRAFAAPDTPVKAGDEVALFPPVSGGQGDAPAGEAARPRGRITHIGQDGLPVRRLSVILHGPGEGRA